MACYVSGSPEKELFKQCPWDPTHCRIAPRRFLIHVMTCSSKGRDPNLVQCTYDLCHVYCKGSEVDHMAECAGFKRDMEEKMAAKEVRQQPVSDESNLKESFDAIHIAKPSRKRQQVEDDWSNESEDPFEDCDDIRKKLYFKNPSEWRRDCFDPETGFLTRPLDKVAYSGLSASEKYNYNRAVSRAIKMDQMSDGLIEKEPEVDACFIPSFQTPFPGQADVAVPSRRHLPLDNRHFVLNDTLREDPPPRLALGRGRRAK